VKAVEAAAAGARSTAAVAERARSAAGSEPAAARGVEPWLVVLPLVNLGFALATGIVLGLKAADPSFAVAALPLQILQPVHTLTAFGCAFSGIAALYVARARELRAGGAERIARIVKVALFAFFPLAALSIASGRGSGKEYLTWAPILTPLLLAVFAALGAHFFTYSRTFSRAAPEASWLIGLGLLCIPAGLVEGSLYEIFDLDFARELSFEWHSLDILFAGTNAALYGFGLVFAGGTVTALRRPLLYLLAAFTFVSTFGHHHYLSPQPTSIKLVAVTASLLAGVSFVRHVRATLSLRGEPVARAPDAFLRAAELWTLIAIGSGILIAIPHVNLVVHGTHAVVAHAMGSLIGVDVMLVLGGLAHYARIEDPRAIRRIGRCVRWINGLLLALWACLTVAGVVKGWLRFDVPHIAYDERFRGWLHPLPILGLALAVPLALVAVDLIRAARRAPARASN
jgi:nitric oxide reductase subunit B